MMQELLDFIEQHIGQGTFIGVHKPHTEDAVAQYIVDYWEYEDEADSMTGGVREIKAGKQKVFTL